MVNLASILDDHPHGHTALVSGEDHVSYGRLRDDVAAARGALTGLGLDPGDRVAIVCGTNPRFVRAWFATIGAGFVAVPLNPQSPAPELQRELAAVGARAAIVGPAGIRAVDGIDRDLLPELRHVLVASGHSGEGSSDFDALVAESAPAPMVDRGDDDLAVLLFTSGTAGAPKAAMLSHGNLGANLRQVQSSAVRAARPDDVLVCVVPLYHVFGLNSILDLGMVAGATVVLVERFDPLSLMHTIESESASMLVGPPTMWSALAAVDDPPLEALAGIRMAVSGAAALREGVVHAVKERLGIELHEGYGLTEASPSLTLSVGTGAPIGSIGRPIGGIEMRLVDSDGDDVYVGDPGEIVVRGPNVFKGYWNNPEATERVLDPDGWLHTGDLAVVDDDGFLSIVDRAKDLIIVSGFNVYPAEVESVLSEHPAVADVAVVGHDHPHSGETVKAFGQLDILVGSAG
ncbi:MAG: AMP-binding protein, partial [Acidimicrobiales bacterium]